MKIFIDNKEFEVNPEKTLLEILKEKGYHIPYYCFHPNIRISASCRVCMVEVELKGRKFLVTSCSTYPVEGMRVFPYSEKSKEARANIIEFLLVHHPIDCPLCEKGGKCDLQNFSYDFGKSLPDFTFEKILPPKQKLNGLLRFYETRCILCYRCSNFWREEVYSDEWLSFGRGKESFVGPFDIKLSDNVPFLGYLTHICPVGAILDDKDYRFGPRPWDMEEKESSCFLCSTGCEIKFCVKKETREKVLKSGIKKKPDKIYKVIAKDDFDNPTIFCDRIFYGKDFISNKKRAFEGLSSGDFKNKLKEKLNSISPDEIIFLISPRETDEILNSIKEFVLKYNIKNICVVPSCIYSGSEKIISDVKYSDFEDSFTLIFHTLPDFSHPVIGFEIFRIMKEGKRRKRVKSTFFEDVPLKKNYFAIFSGFEDRFLKNADFSLKMDLKASYEFLLDLLYYFYREKNNFPEIQGFKIENIFFFEESIRERTPFFEESEVIYKKIKDFEKFILIFNDSLPSKVQILLYILSKFHPKGKVFNLRSAFNTEGFLRIFNNFEFLSFKSVKEMIKKGDIKMVLLYRVHPLYDADIEFFDLIKDKDVFYMSSFKCGGCEKFNSLFIRTPFEYGGSFIDNMGERKKIGKLFDYGIFGAENPGLVFEEECGAEISPKIWKIDLIELLKNDIPEDFEFLIEKPSLWDINLMFSENIKRDFDFASLKPILKLRRLFEEF